MSRHSGTKFQINAYLKTWRSFQLNWSNLTESIQDMIYSTTFANESAPYEKPEWFLFSSSKSNKINATILLMKVHKLRTICPRSWHFLRFMNCAKPWIIMRLSWLRPSTKESLRNEFAWCKIHLQIHGNLENVHKHKFL